MYFAIRCIIKRFPFRIASEMNIAMKFDDIVLEYSTPNNKTKKIRFIQAKHTKDKLTEKKCISSKELMAMNGRFGLPKYYHSFLVIQQTPEFQNREIQDFIILTNLRFQDVEVSKKPSDNLLQKTDDGTMKYLKKVADWKDDLINFECGEIYKFIDKDHEARPELLNILRTKFEDSLEMNKLVVEFVKIVLGLTKNGIIYKPYAPALVKFVIDVKTKKLHKKFLGKIWDVSTTEDHKLFRQLFEETYFILAGPQNSTWENVSSYELKNMTLFEKYIIVESNPQLNNPQSIADNLATLISNCSNDRKEIEVNDELGQDINYLAGHVFVEGKDNNIFIQADFLTTNQLPGNLCTFQSQLKYKLGPTLFEKLGEFNFKIPTLKTCTIDDLGNYLNPIFPIGQSTDENINDFLDLFVFGTNQPNVDELATIINQEIGKTFNHLEVDFISARFGIEMLEWLMSTLGTFKSDKDLNLFLQDLQNKTTSVMMRGLTLDYTEKISRTNINFLHNEEWSKKLIGFLESSSDNLLLLLTPDKQNLLSALKVLTFFQSEAEVSLDRKFHYLWFTMSTLVRVKNNFVEALASIKEKLTLVIECDNMVSSFEEFGFAFKLEKLFNSKNLQLILIGGESNILINFFKARQDLKSIEFQMNTSFMDLDDVSKQKLMNRKVHFQGNELTLAELIPEGKADLLNSIDVSELLSETILFLGQPEMVLTNNYNLNDCYIQREFCFENKFNLKAYFKYLKEIHDNLRKYVREEMGRTASLANFKSNFENDISKWFEAQIGKTKTTDNLLGFFQTDLIKFALAIKQEINQNETPILNRNSEQLDNSEKERINETVKNYFKKYCSYDKIVINNNLEEHFEEFCRTNPDCNVHWLVETHASVAEIHWKKTRGSIAFIRKYITDECTVIPENDLLNLHVGNVLIISDTPGMGKSTILSNLIQDRQNITPAHWLVRINLNDYSKVFLAKKDVKNAFEYLSVDLLGIVEPLEMLLFTEYCNTPRKSSIYFDGFDEISPNHKDVVLELIAKLSKAVTSQIVVATRPETREFLENKFQQFAYTLKKFSKLNQIDFLTKFWTKRIDIQPASVEKEFLASYVHTLLESFIDADVTLIGIPLQTRMIAEIYEDNVKKCVDLKNLEHTRPVVKVQLIDMYQKFIDKKLEIYFKEKGKRDESNVTHTGDKEILIKNYMKVHQQLALQLLLSENILKTLPNTKVPEYNDDFLLKIGLMQKNYSTIDFIHRTYAEYFVFLYYKEYFEDGSVSEFIVGNIFCNRDGNTIIRAFFNNFFEETTNWNENILEMYGHSLLNNSNNSALKTAAEESRKYIFAFILRSISETMNQNPLKKLILSEICSESQLHFFLASNNDVTVLSSFFQFVLNNFESIEVTKVLKEKQENGFDLFCMPGIEKVDNAFGKFKVLLNFVESAMGKAETYKMIFSKIKNGSTIFLEMIKSNNIIIFEFLINIYKETINKNHRLQSENMTWSEVLEHKNWQSENMLHCTLNNRNSSGTKLTLSQLSGLSQKQLKTLLLQQDQNKLNPLSSAVSQKNNETNIELMLQHIQEHIDNDIVSEIFSQPSKNGRRLLHSAAAYQNTVATIVRLVTVLKTKSNPEEFYEILFLQDDVSATFMNRIIENQPENNIEPLLLFIEDQVGRTRYHQLLYDKERKCSPAIFSAFLSNSESIAAHFIALSQKHFGDNILKELLSFQNRKNRNILHFNVEKSQLNLGFCLDHFKHLLVGEGELKKLLLETDILGMNPLNRAVSLENNEANIEILFKFILEEFASDSVKEIFSQPSLHGRRILHLAAKKQQNFSSTEILLIGLKNKLNSAQFHEILFLQNEFDETFVNVLIRFQQEHSIYHMLSSIENLVGLPIFSKLLADIGSQCTPVICSALFSKSLSTVNHVAKLTKQHFGENILQKLYLFQNRHKRNILHLAFETSSIDLNFVFECLKTELDINTVNQMLLARDLVDLNPLSRAVTIDSNNSYLKDICVLIQEKVDKNTVIQLYTQPSKDGRRILHLAAKLQNTTAIANLLEVLRKRTENSGEFIEILLLKDNFDMTFLSALIRDHSENKSSQLRSYVKKQVGEGAYSVLEDY
jgi:hypothetical protein